VSFSLAVILWVIQTVIFCNYRRAVFSGSAWLASCEPNYFEAESRKVHTGVLHEECSACIGIRLDHRLSCIEVDTHFRLVASSWALSPKALFVKWSFRRGKEIDDDWSPIDLTDGVSVLGVPYVQHITNAVLTLGGMSNTTCHTCDRHGFHRVRQEVIRRTLFAGCKWYVTARSRARRDAR
jgi:hypothetical protein